MKMLELTADPTGVTTVIGLVITPEGTTASIRLEEMTENVAGVAPNRTAVAPVKLEPKMVTIKPGAPASGEKLEMTGPPAIAVAKCEKPVRAETLGLVNTPP